jgi:lauroyl/myristoyl acyltransferase
VQRAGKFMSIADPNAWASAYRLMRLVDHADLYLSRFRGDRWLRRYLHVRGPDWPTGGPVLAITFHWGAGLWGLWHLRARKQRVTGPARHVEENDFSGAPLQKLYARLRTTETVRACGAPLIYADGRSILKIRQALASTTSVVALFDVVARDRRHALEVSFLGRTALFPRGVLFAALTAKAPVVAFRVALDRNNGHRTVIISRPLQAKSEQELLRNLVSLLEEAIRDDPAAWHHWPGVDAFFKHDAQLPSAQTAER